MKKTITYICKRGSRGYLLALEQIASELHLSLQILLASQSCVHRGRAEIPEEISAQFDILLDDAKRIRQAFDSYRRRAARTTPTESRRTAA